MSLQFNDTTNRNGIIQHIEKNIGFNRNEISGNTNRLADFTADVNLAYGELLAFIFNVGGTWQWDDSNHTDYPIITTDLTSGQQDYSFTNDENGNLILDIFKVLVKDVNGVYQEAIPVDRQSEADTEDFSNNISGDSLYYDKTANGIFFKNVPNATRSAGIQLLVSREAVSFTTSDTTKKPGVDGRIHEYFALHPAYRYARTKGLPQTELLKRDLDNMMELTKKIYARRERDVRRRLVPNRESSR